MRIFQRIGAGENDQSPDEGKNPAVVPNGALRRCSFCPRLLTRDRFVAFSKPLLPGQPPKAGICARCILTFARMRRFADAYTILYEIKPDWTRLQRRIERALSCEPASPRLRRILTMISLRLAKRAASLIAGYKQAECPVTGVSLLPPRIALIGRNASGCEKLLSLASSATGLPVVSTTGIELLTMRPMRQLMKLSNGEISWTRLGTIFILDGYYESDTPVAMIFACKNRLACPSDIEAFDIEGFEQSELC